MNLHNHAFAADRKKQRPLKSGVGRSRYAAGNSGNLFPPD
jgi:hypothetical protein